MGWLRKIAWGLLWKWFRARLMEKSTWVGIFALLAAFGLPVNPEFQDQLAFLLAESVEGDYWQLDYLQAVVTIVGAVVGGTLIGIKEKGKTAAEPAPDPVAEATFGYEAGRVDSWTNDEFKAELNQLDANVIEAANLDASAWTYQRREPPQDEPRPVSDKVKNAKPRKGRGGRR